MTEIKLSKEVMDALNNNRPVVALESTIISHGLPRPRNLDAAKEFEEILRSQGVTPATIAILDGTPNIKRVAMSPNGAGVRVFATGGLGGVHRGASSTFDESADLSTLAVTPITVVAAGVKSVLDIPATLERLETLSVPVVGWQTKNFPAFWLTQSGYTLDWKVDSAEEIAQLMKAQDELGHGQGIVVANPLPESKQWDPAEHDRVLEIAFKAADKAGITGKAVTPFLLGFIVEESKGKSLEVNLDLARNNVALAGKIAKAWSAIQ